MTGSYAAVWAIDEHDFPGNDGTAGRLRFALRYAILAPSGHNGQPWLFRIDGDLLSVRADRSRALPAVDPHDRELLISCAAAAHLVEVALRHFGYQPAVELLPDPADPDLLATVRLGAPGDAPEARDLFDAVRVRHSNRHPYQARAVPAGQLARRAPLPLPRGPGSSPSPTGPASPPLPTSSPRATGSNGARGCSATS